MSLASDVQALLAEQCETHKMPGASAAFLHEGEVHYASYGITAVDNPVDVDPDTMFGIGSTSKTLTGTAMMALVERGKVSLDDRVVKHLPDLPVLDEQARDTVTVGQLLDHTAGWVGDGGTVSGWGDDALTKAVPALLANAPQQSAPGQHMSYSNTSFTIAGLLIATVNETTFEQAVQQLVLEPLGMKNTAYLVWDIANRKHAIGHVATPDGPVPVPTWITDRWLGPAGGTFSTARDVMTYAKYHLLGEQALTGDAKAPISEESRLLMQTQRSSSRSGFDGTGVSWLMGSRGDLRLIEHGGNLSNLMVSTFTLAPQHEFAVTVMGNSQAGAAVGTVVRDYLLDQITDVPRVVSVPLEPQPDLSEYVGIYEAGQWNIEVIEKDGTLDFGMRMKDPDIAEEMRALFESKRTQVVFFEPDRVTSATEPGAAAGDFLRDSSGAIEFFRTGMRLATKRS